MKIAPINQFRSTTENVQNIIAEYGFDLKEYKPATSGIENTTLILRCAQGRFVLRVYRQDKKSDKQILQEVNFTKYLHDKGVKTPVVVPNKNGYPLTTITLGKLTWQAILMEYIVGEHAKSYSLRLVQNMATIQAQMHILSSAYPDAQNVPNLRSLKPSHFTREIDTTTLDDSRLISFLERARSYHVSLNKKLPSGLCHLDYDKDNIIVDRQGVITILDFDDLKPAAFILDLSYTLLHIHYCAGEAIAREYLSAYETIRRLNNLEKSCIQSLKLYRHYMLCSHSVLEGRVDATSIRKYLDLEKACIE